MLHFWKVSVTHPTLEMLNGLGTGLSWGLVTGSGSQGHRVAGPFIGHPFCQLLHPPPWLPFTRGGYALSVIAASVSQPWPGRQLHLGWEEEAGDRLTR